MNPDELMNLIQRVQATAQTPDPMSFNRQVDMFRAGRFADRPATINPLIEYMKQRQQQAAPMRRQNNLDAGMREAGYLPLRGQAAAQRIREANAQIDADTSRMSNTYDRMDRIAAIDPSDSRGMYLAQESANRKRLGWKPSADYRTNRAPAVELTGYVDTPDDVARKARLFAEAKAKSADPKRTKGSAYDLAGMEKRRQQIQELMLEKNRARLAQRNQIRQDRLMAQAAPALELARINALAKIAAANGQQNGNPIQAFVAKGLQDGTIRLQDLMRMQAAVRAGDFSIFDQTPEPPVPGSLGPPNIRYTFPPTRQIPSPSSQFRRNLTQGVSTK